MRRLLVAAMMLGAVTSARAADLPFLRGGFGDGYGRPNVIWQGVYVGAQGSWGSVNSDIPANINRDMQSTFNPPAGVTYEWGPTGIGHSLNGGYGAFFGYNSQWDDVVIGIEGNYIHDNFRTTVFGTAPAIATDGTVVGSTYTSATMKLTDFGSLRLRAGYAVNCFLPYAFIGAGFGSQVLDRSSSATPAPVGPAPAWMTDSKSKLIYGYTAGFGTDVTLTGGLFGRAEYEYKRVTSNIESNINTFRLGLGYRF